ncbi:hypothetical protein ACTJKZ_11980 [Pantoea sp. 22096]|uniref:hypothetical protein n=1 Tax=Pantoea sp. 22096 TaxID=3453873 RepID=UPI003F831ADA
MSLVYIPALIPLLLKKENEKGSPLTEEEVISVRDSATCIEVASDIAFTMAECRGYFDINPEKCWDEWRVLRKKGLDSTGDK